MDIPDKILETTYLISHESYLNSAYTNGWTHFKNHVIQYDKLLDDITKYDNKFLIIDFFKRSLDRCMYMKKISQEFNLHNKEANEKVRENIKEIVEYFMGRIKCGISQV